jgi:hypothetical protein
LVRFGSFATDPISGRDEVRIEVGIDDPAKFNQLAAPIEAKHAAPWLKKFKEDGNEVVRVIVPGEAHTAKVATPEQIASGVFYENYDDYVRRVA